MHWETTTILLERLRDSEDEAWARFTDRFRAPLVRFGVRMGLSEPAAEDAAQDALIAFIEGYREGRYDRSRGRLGSWLFTLAYHAIRSERRDGQRADRQAPAAQSGRTTFFSAIPDEAQARAGWEEDWDRHVLAQCLDHLKREVGPTAYRAFELFTFQGVPAQEVADQLGVSRDSVYQSKYRALKRLTELRETLDAVEVGAR